MEEVERYPARFYGGISRFVSILIRKSRKYKSLLISKYLGKKNPSAIIFYIELKIKIQKNYIFNFCR